MDLLCFNAKTGFLKNLKIRQPSYCTYPNFSRISTYSQGLSFVSFIIKKSGAEFDTYGSPNTSENICVNGAPISDIMHIVSIN